MIIFSILTQNLNQDKKNELPERPSCLWCKNPGTLVEIQMGITLVSCRYIWMFLGKTFSFINNITCMGFWDLLTKISIRKNPLAIERCHYDCWIYEIRNVRGNSLYDKFFLGFSGLYVKQNENEVKYILSNYITVNLKFRLTTDTGICIVNNFVFRAVIFLGSWLRF